jgi:hypothetical protein
VLVLGFRSDVVAVCVRVAFAALSLGIWFLAFILAAFDP